jgi:O-acetyl-ADP-ribose deacetylase (regulator of RNase III)
MLPDHLKTVFQFGTSQVRIYFGDILNPGVSSRPEAIVAIEDNYLSMASLFSRRLQNMIGKGLVQRAQADSPVKAGSLVISDVRKTPAMQKITKYVYHAAVLDCDFGSKSIEELLLEACRSSLETAVDQNLRSIAIQIPPAGTGGLTMSGAARSLCSAIKVFLAEERALKEIHLVLEGVEASSAGVEHAVHQDGNGTRMVDFLREANAILASPYDPQERVRQARDFFGREAEMEMLGNLLSGNIHGKRHALLMGGPGIGKWMLLDQLYYQSQLPDNPLGKTFFLARVSFTPQLPAGDPAFLFRKLITAMIRHEPDESRRKILREAYASPGVGSRRFKKILADYQARSLQVVFLCDGFPREITAANAGAAGDPSLLDETVAPFYKAIEEIERETIFLISAHDGTTFDGLQTISGVAPGFLISLVPMWVKAVSDRERTSWVNAIYQRYLGTTQDAPQELQRYVEEEAGNHPYLISLACHLMLNPMKRVALNSPSVAEQGWGRVVLRGIAENARRLIATPRSAFFDRSVGLIPHAEAVDLFNLSRAVIAEEQTRMLGPALASGDPNAQARLTELLVQGNPRDLLHTQAIEWLINHGYVSKSAGGKEVLSVPALARYALEKLGGFKRPEDRPGDVTVSLLYHVHEVRSRLTRSTIRTLFNSRGGRVLAAEKNFDRNLRQDFMENFNRFLKARRGEFEGDQSVFRNVEEVGNFLLSQYATLAVKRYLENPPPGCTINFLVDDPLKDIPWELMLEAAYAGEIPFQVGRSTISSQPPGNVRSPVRGPGQVKALLIGNPTGDLAVAGYEVEWLEGALSHNSRFDKPDVLAGPDACQRIQVLNALSSGRYGLVHYSGHSRSAGEFSAWGLSDGEITTDQLGNAVQAAPPVMVFASSCFSGAGGEWQPIEYENQAFDLPGAFLGAGVEAYIGTLWEVEEDAARRLVERFYTMFLNGDVSLGECLRRARQSLKLEQERREKIDWLAFVLYGDPRLMPVDLFPAFRN